MSDLSPSYRIETDPNTVFVDVDGTLLIWPTKAGRPGRDEKGIVNETPKVNRALVDGLARWQKETGGQLVIWTRGGKAHAEFAARICGLEGAICVGKPRWIIDDATLERVFRGTHYRGPNDFHTERFS